MRDHLTIVTVSCPDRPTLAQLEDEVTALLDPPLSLQRMSAPPVRRLLRELGKEIS